MPNSMVDRSFLLSVFLLLFASSATLIAGGVSSLNTFPAGTYRQDGVCKRLVQGNIDRSAACAPYIGVIARQDDLPMFMFSQMDGYAMIFFADSNALFGQNRDIAAYSVSQVYDSETKGMYPLHGECVITIAPQGEEVRCTTWREKERRTVAWEGRFFGKGVWSFVPRVH